MKILLLSAYDAYSHRYWREHLCRQFADATWAVLTLPPRHFNWRIRGNSVLWASQSRDVLEDHYDLVVATSMVDFATLRGLVPSLSQVPSILYFHENQLDYPVSQAQRQRWSIEPAMVQITSAMAADQLCFNSEHNRKTFLNGIETLFKKLPDKPLPNLADTFLSKSKVVSVPIHDAMFEAQQGTDSAGEILWNHRWEYDKGPERLLACLRALPKERALTFHIVGQSFRRQPEVFTDIKALLTERLWLGTWGYVESQDDYLALLDRSSMVVSTALHDFQGLSILEAVARSCIPVVPDRLAYQEIFPSANRYEANDNVEKEARNMADLILTLLDQPDVSAPDVSGFSWRELRPHYQALFESVVSM